MWGLPQLYSWTLFYHRGVAQWMLLFLPSLTSTVLMTRLSKRGVVELFQDLRPHHSFLSPRGL